MYSSDLFEYDQKGNGAILIWENKFVFAVAKEAYWDKTTDPWTITYTNTGGHVESGEGMIDSTKREVKEELGSEIEILHSARTLFCNLEDQIFTEYKLKDEISPMIIYNSSQIQMSVAVYIARLLNEPKPQMEVPAILLLPRLLLKGGYIVDLLANGGNIKEQRDGIIPRVTILQPFGSAELLAKYYDKFKEIAQIEDFIS